MTYTKDWIVLFVQQKRHFVAFFLFFFLIRFNFCDIYFGILSYASAARAFRTPFTRMALDSNDTFERLHDVFQRHSTEMPFDSEEHDGRPLRFSNAFEMQAFILSHAVPACRITKNSYLPVQLGF